MEITKIFAANLRRCRVNRKMTQQELADKAGTSVQSIRDLEGGRRNPSFAVVESLTNVFKIESYEFFKSEKEEAPPLSMDLLIKSIGSIPLNIYEMAGKIGKDDEIAWGDVKAVLEVAIERIEAKKKNKKA